MLKIRGSAYGIDQSTRSKHYGCIMLNGKYIDSDYDLWDIMDPTARARTWASWKNCMDNCIFGIACNAKVEEYLNRTPLAQMVQHSGEMQRGVV